MLFSQRKRLAELCEEWCEERKVKACALNVVSALESLGHLRQPGEKSIRMMREFYAAESISDLVAAEFISHFKTERQNDEIETANGPDDPPAETAG